MMNKWIYILTIMPLLSFISLADTGGTNTDVPSDSTASLCSYEKESKKRDESKKVRKKRKRREKIVIDKKASLALHKSMLTAGDHKHGFSHLKVHRGKGPLGPQTFCPVMGGPIDTTIYVDYEGVRVYFCCKGCIYNFKLTPNLYLKTLKRYGEKPKEIEPNLKRKKIKE